MSAEGHNGCVFFGIDGRGARDAPEEALSAAGELVRTVQLYVVIDLLNVQPCGGADALRVSETLSPEVMEKMQAMAKDHAVLAELKEANRVLFVFPTRYVAMAVLSM
jgi:NAD(P)H dehydrogenase (quinone)